MMRGPARAEPPEVQRVLVCVNVFKNKATAMRILSAIDVTTMILSYSQTGQAHSTQPVGRADKPLAAC